MSDKPAISSAKKISVKPPILFKKPLPFYWICDCSESMGLKNRSNNLVCMDEINKTIPLAIEAIKYISMIRGARISMRMRTLKFSDHAEWVDKFTITVDQYSWKNLSAEKGGCTLGEAFIKVAQDLKPIVEVGTMPKKAYPPVLVLITDGYPTDDWKSGLDSLNKISEFRGSCRIAFNLADADPDVIQEFIGNYKENIIPITEFHDIKKIFKHILLDYYFYDGPYRVPLVEKGKQKNFPYSEK